LSGSAVSRLFELGRAAWPEVSVDREAFARYVRERAPDEEDRPALRAPEIYLACACAGGDGRAIAIFDERYLADVPMFLSRLQPPPHLIADVRQQLLERLFVDGKIAQYSGRGPLRSWLRVVTLRVASDLRRQERPHAEIDEAVPTQALDPELALVKVRYREAFRAALRDAFSALTQEERSVLRLHYLDGLNAERIGVILRLSRATVTRRIAAARERVLAEIHGRLKAQLHATQKELESLLGAVRSDLAMSLSLVFGRADGETQKKV
jgi:RNA polymerase sigma-70 factor (ECF subfamily)